MPNQRAKNKVLIGAFVDAQLKTRIARLAEHKGITTSDILGDALRLYLERDTSSTTSLATSPNAIRKNEPDTERTDEVWLL